MVISSRFHGPSELRTADGRFEAVLPEATQFEFALQHQIMANKLANACYRVGPRPSFLARLFGSLA